MPLGNVFLCGGGGHPGDLLLVWLAVMDAYPIHRRQNNQKLRPNRLRQASAGLILIDYGGHPLVSLGGFDNRDPPAAHGNHHIAVLEKMLYRGQFYDALGLRGRDNPAVSPAGILHKGKAAFLLLPQGFLRE